MTDFSTIQLTRHEKIYCLKLRIYKKLPYNIPNLLRLRFIEENRTDQRDSFGMYIGDGTYSLTDKYERYCGYRRDKFFFGSIWPTILAGIVSFIVSIAVNIVLLKLGLTPPP